MILLLILLVGLSCWAIGATVLLVLRDGYGALPEREPRLVGEDERHG